MKDKLIINTNKLIWLIDLDKINFFKSDDCYTNVLLVDSQQFILCKSLSKLQDEINSTSFVRIHGSYLVNKKSIKAIDKSSKTIILFNDLSIPYTIRLKDLLSQLREN